MNETINSFSYYEYLQSCACVWTRHCVNGNVQEIPCYKFMCKIKKLYVVQ